MLLERVYTAGSEVRYSSRLQYNKQRRLNKLDIRRINKRIANDIVIVLALDNSTGIKVTNRGGEWWLAHKWNIRKGYLEIHVAVDIKKKKRKLYP